MMTEMNDRMDNELELVILVRWAFYTICTFHTSPASTD